MGEKGGKGDIGCSETLREVERYVDGECLRELTVKVQTHLAGCTDCNDHAEFKKHMKLLIATKCRGERLRGGGAERIRHRIRPANP
jgi:mycothiol system anti-sigma-R factor